ncbi:MAG: hypothetical protein D3907_11580 [Candidatus Electrothrix sp. AUS3]|nr:hypothetical protein [Candidatus Electrothrix gigas]
MTFAEIQKKFVAYYQNAGFQQLPRASMLHPSIPLSFVMSAGLVQVEEVLLHSQERSGNRFVLVQDCFRHFDLKAVGTDGIHLSLFEMPGAFMFGRDGHKELIARMWEFAVNSLQLDPQRIWISYFHGGISNGRTLSKDAATYAAWQSVGIPENRLIGLGLKDNYWIQGNGSHEAGDDEAGDELRKCGSCTELFYDLGEERSCSSQCRPGCRCGRFVEFANSLFIFTSFDPKTNHFSPLDDPYGETVIGDIGVFGILAPDLKDGVYFRVKMNRCRGMGHDLVDHAVGQGVETGNLAAGTGYAQTLNGNSLFDLISQTLIDFF